jgi:glycosyltransferase involved in cell wall biosynthesis
MHIVVGVTSPQTCLILPARLRAFRAAGFRVSVVSAPGELLREAAQASDAEAFALPMKRGIAPISDGIALFRLWWLVRRLKPDIVEFSTPKAGLLGSLAAKLCRIPVRIYLLRGLKLEGSLGLKRQLLFLAERLSCICAHVVVCNSHSLREQALVLGVGAKEKLVVIGDGSSNGVDLERFSPGQQTRLREELGIPRTARVLGYVGRLTCDKGIPELIEAFATILKSDPGTYLLLVGWFDASEDALDVGIRSRIESHPRIICTGFVVDTAPYYRLMDLLILPSWREGFPNVALEAAATGVPVITTHCTGSRDAIVPEVTGLSVPPGDPDAISAAVLSLLCNSERRKRMGRAARAWVASRYEDRLVLRRTVGFYQALIVRRTTAVPQLLCPGATGDKDPFP